MDIQNCKITKATVDFTLEDGGKTIISLETISQKGRWAEKFIFPYEKPQFEFQFLSIMEYADVHNVTQLSGRIIREITNTHNEVIGFGDPIKDAFILIGEGKEMKNWTEAEIIQQYN